jgi:hypothetical protein
MIGRRYWILIWYGILAIGVVGLVVAAYWGRRTAWKNLDEVLRAVGTITVSIGMLLLLYSIAGGIAQALLVGSLFAFVLAFILGRRQPPPPDPESEEDESE